MEKEKIIIDGKEYIVVTKLDEEDKNFEKDDIDVNDELENTMVITNE